MLTLSWDSAWSIISCIPTILKWNSLNARWMIRDKQRKSSVLSVLNTDEIELPISRSRSIGHSGNNAVSNFHISIVAETNRDIKQRVNLGQALPLSIDKETVFLFLDLNPVIDTNRCTSRISCQWIVKTWAPALGNRTKSLQCDWISWMTWRPAIRRVTSVSAEFFTIHSDWSISGQNVSCILSHNDVY